MQISNVTEELINLRDYKELEDKYKALQEEYDELKVEFDNCNNIYNKLIEEFENLNSFCETISNILDEIYYLRNNIN